MQINVLKYITYTEYFGNYIRSISVNLSIVYLFSEAHLLSIHTVSWSNHHLAK